MTQHEIVTRAEAKARGLTRYFTGKPCKSGHVSGRRTSTGDCIECKRIAANARYAADPERFRAEISERRRADPEGSRAYQRARYAQNPERFKAQNRAWYGENKDWRLAANARRRAGKIAATAAWDAELTGLVEREAFDLATRRDLVTGFAWHVDHMIPLRGRRVSGLHVWNNLQVIPGALNVAKCNRMMLTQPGEWVRHI